MTTFRLFFSGVHSESSGGSSITNEDLLKELMSPDHLTDLIQLMNPVCNPWSAHIQEYLKARQVTWAKANGNKTDEYVYTHPEWI